METFLKPLKPASFFIFLSLMGGILMGSLLPENTAGGFVLIFLLSVLVFFSFYFYKKILFFVMLCVFFSLGYFSIQQKLYPSLPKDHISNYLDLKKNRITGRVVSFAKHHEKRQSLTILCQSLETKNLPPKKVCGRIKLNIYRSCEPVPMYGDHIQFESTIRPVRNFMNPGAFDYERWLKFQKIYGIAHTDMRKIKIVSHRDQISIVTNFIRKIETLRTNFYFFIVKEPSKSGKILAALITGKKESLSSDMRDLFSKAGISHLFAISGLHLSIVSVLSFYMFYRFLSFMPQLLIAGKSKKLAGVLTLVPLIGYAVFTGFSPSTQRALLMIIVLLFSYVSEKENDILSSISVAGSLILMMDSSALFSISFQLSFIAVIFIVFGVSLLKNKGVVTQKNIISKTGLLVCVTFFAGLGTAPLTAHYFNIVSTISLVSNTLFIPVIGFLVLPMGLISLFFYSFFPLFSLFLLHLNYLLIRFSLDISEFLVSIPYSWSRTITLQWAEIISIYLIFLLIYFILKGYKKRVAIVSVSFFLLILYNFLPAAIKKISRSNLNVTILDVGQGNSALIQTPEKKNILVDGGGFSDNTSFDTGRFIVAPFLWQKKIRTLDCVILSHPEADHLNGLIFILKNFDVKKVIKNKNRKNSNPYETLIKTCEEKKITIWHAPSQLDHMDIGSTRFLFYDSNSDLFSNDLNNNSLVFKVIYKNFSMLFPGDILVQREKRLCFDTLLDLESTLLQAPHHGSATSSSEFFLDKVRPKSVIISCGWHNRYGFPHETVLKRYIKMKTRVFRTDKDGAIFISSDGNAYTINTYKGG